MFSPRVTVFLARKLLAERAALVRRLLMRLKVIPGVVEPVLEERIGILDPVDVADEGILIGVQPLIKEGCLNNTVIEDVMRGV